MPPFVCCTVCSTPFGIRDHLQIEAIFLDLSVLSASLGLVGRLLIDADRCCDSVLIGKIKQYTGLISDGVTELQEVLY
ncbi:MAG: hypothetical protein D3909_14730 [Candidatus Electrothrix sp. ATG1]|nr:hypothetical protein [Candidatus Electrothrix sp. ATG1]